jgi:hypothetical protein
MDPGWLHLHLQIEAVSGLFDNENEGITILLKMRSTHPTTQYHIVEDFNLPQHH